MLQILKWKSPESAVVTFKLVLQLSIKNAFESDTPVFILNKLFRPLIYTLLMLLKFVKNAS